MQTVGSGLWREHRKTWKNSNTHSKTWTLGKKKTSEKHKKRKTHTVGPGICQEN